MAKKIFLFLLVIFSWVALIAQFYLIIVNRVASIPETIVRFFSFYTILTNLLVAFSFSFILIKPKCNWAMWFSRPKVITAITMYITLVGLVYNAILRFLWKPEGLQFWVDELLHTAIPLLCILFWFIFVAKAELKWKDAFPWLIYPFVYIFFVLIRGKISGYYPYPFINVIEIGYDKVWLHTGLLAVCFLFFSLLYIAIGKMMSRKT